MTPTVAAVFNRQATSKQCPGGLSATGNPKLRWLIGSVAGAVLLVPVVIFVALSRDIAPPKVDDLVLTR